MSKPTNDDDPLEGYNARQRDAIQKEARSIASQTPGAGPDTVKDNIRAIIASGPNYISAIERKHQVHSPGPHTHTAPKNGRKL